jgi:hypothetical protein
MTISISGRQPSLSHDDFCLAEKEGEVLLEVITVHFLRFHVKQPRVAEIDFLNKRCIACPQ